MDQLFEYLTAFHLALLRLRRHVTNNAEVLVTNSDVQDTWQCMFVVSNRYRICDKIYYIPSMWRLKDGRKHIRTAPTLFVDL